MLASILLGVSKGAIITEGFVEALGLKGSLYTLRKGMENRPHPTLLEPMFHIHVEELEEPVYLERQYLYDHQFTIKPTYGAGEKILLWVHRTWRRRNEIEEEELQPLLVATDLFMLKDPREFLRFRLFLRSKRILDVQARDFLSKNAERFCEIAKQPKGLHLICGCLGNISEWPDPENGFRRRAGDEHTLEGLAKTYSAAIVAVRSIPALPKVLLTCDPEQRLNIFRLMCFAEDPEEGANSLMVFLRDLGQETGVERIIRETSHINTGHDLSRSLESLRTFLALPVAMAHKDH